MALSGDENRELREKIREKNERLRAARRRIEQKDREIEVLRARLGGGGGA